MKLTREQESIINSTGDIKINAVAGSGKTTTVTLYAKSRPADSRILYLAFNKSVKLEAVQKFAKHGVMLQWRRPIRWPIKMWCTVVAIS